MAQQANSVRKEFGMREAFPRADGTNHFHCHLLAIVRVRSCCFVDRSVSRPSKRSTKSHEISLNIRVASCDFVDRLAESAPGHVN